MPAENSRAVTVEELSRCQGKERTVYYSCPEMVEGREKGWVMI